MAVTSSDFDAVTGRLLTYTAGTDDTPYACAADVACPTQAIFS